MVTLIYGIYEATSACCSLPLGVSGRKAESGIIRVWRAVLQTAWPSTCTSSSAKQRSPWGLFILSADVDGPCPMAFEAHWRKWFAGVSSASLDYLRSPPSSFCDFAYRHLIQVLSSVCSTENFNTNFESFDLLTCLTIMHRKGSVPSKTQDPQNEFLLQDYL